MSMGSRYRMSVKHWLIKDFRWWPHTAKEFVFRNKDEVIDLRKKGLSTFKAAEYINTVYGRK